MTTIDNRKTGGFAAMDPERRRELARKGGKNCQATGNAHRFTHEQAQEAGRKGGLISKKGGKKSE